MRPEPNVKSALTDPSVVSLGKPLCSPLYIPSAHGLRFPTLHSAMWRGQDTEEPRTVVISFVFWKDNPTSGERSNELLSIDDTSYKSALRRNPKPDVLLETNAEISAADSPEKQSQWLLTKQSQVCYQIEEKHAWLGSTVQAWCLGHSGSSHQAAMEASSHHVSLPWPLSLPNNTIDCGSWWVDICVLAVLEAERFRIKVLANLISFKFYFFKTSILRPVGGSCYCSWIPQSR